MYESHFRLHRRPFSPAADTHGYVDIGPMEDARQTLVRAIERGSGPAVVIGAAGTGKTMLCLVIAEQFREKMRVAVLANGRLASPRALYQAILFELGLPYREMDENELRLSLVDFLSDGGRCPGGMLLVIDEAHVLPLRLLEEVRLLTNVVHAGKPQVRVVLAGGPTLEERFASPKLESFNQRIAARCYLESFNRDETSAFIKEQLTMAGAPHGAIFNAEALSAVYDATDGIPRLVSQLCDHALVMAAVGRHRTVDAAVVQEAWSDLQQLPAPWVEPAAKVVPIFSQPDVIEFGALSDEGADETPTSIPFRQRSEQPVSQPAGVAARERPTDEDADPERRLAEIERQVAAVSSSEECDRLGDGEAPRPAAAAPAADPFSETFDEEEVVVDGYASLQESFFATAPRVRSEEGRQIAALLAEAATVGGDSVDDVGGDAVGDQRQYVVADEYEGRRRQQELTEAVAALLPKATPPDDKEEMGSADVDADDLEYAAGNPMRLHAADEPRRMDPLADDRDVIIVQEEDPFQPPPPASGKPAKRQKYRQLFARLRQA